MSYWDLKSCTERDFMCYECEIISILLWEMALDLERPFKT